jgi:hypothetical protein
MQIYKCMHTLTSISDFIYDIYISFINRAFERMSPPSAHMCIYIYIYTYICVESMHKHSLIFVWIYKNIKSNLDIRIWQGVWVCVVPWYICAQIHISMYMQIYKCMHTITSISDFIYDIYISFINRAFERMSPPSARGKEGVASREIFVNSQWALG